MANKHVLNPCANSGKAVDVEALLPAVNGVIKAKCDGCGKSATVNKKTMLFRKHKAAELNGVA